MKLRALALSSALLFTASSASAATSFDILTTVVSNGRTPTTMVVGDTLTVRLRINGGSAVFGLGASAFNYTESVLDFVSGTSVASINHAVCIPGTGCFSGLTNSNPTSLSESAIGLNGNRVQIFNGVGLTATNANAQDPGLDGIVGGGDAQVLIVFEAKGDGSTQLRIGTGYNGDGEVLAGGVTNQDANTTINVTVPEPATLAAGLAALTTVGGLVAIRRRF